MNHASLDRMNRKLAGCVVDYTHNHGHDRRIYSPILGMPRDLYVYLPPGYSRSRAYPLIVYLHLAYVDEHVFVGSDWIVQLDRLIQRGEFPPVVVACPDGTIQGENRTRSQHSFYINGCGGRFQDHLLLEVYPFLTRCFSIRPEREAHALVGLSAGGFGALNLAIKRRDLFGAVATLAGPANLRYYNCDCNYREDFDPATYRWRDEYNPDEVAAVFYLGLRRVRIKKYIEPVFGSGDQVEERITRENPADLLTLAGLQPGELAIYLNYPGRDNWNFDAQDESFAWLAGRRGIQVTAERDPGARHSLPYFRSNHEPLYRWLRGHLLPPVAVAPGG
jgi:pimeloyl-ACP methyl ester carboxylesterase